MKREELRNKYIREICDKNNKALRHLAETNSARSNYIAELANDIEREVDALLNEDKVVIGFKRLSDDAILPTKAHPTDSGYDLYAAEDIIIEPGDTAIVKTGIAVELPAGYEAQIRPRSGITAKTKLRIQLGTIDKGYRGELGVIVDNINSFSADNFVSLLTYIDGKTSLDNSGGLYGEGTYLIRKGEKIAQLVVQHLPQIIAEEVHNLEETERGDAGFGSTGI